MRDAIPDGFALVIGIHQVMPCRRQDLQVAREVVGPHTAIAGLDQIKVRSCTPGFLILIKGVYALVIPSVVEYLRLCWSCHLKSLRIACPMIRPTRNSAKNSALKLVGPVSYRFVLTRLTPLLSHTRWIRVDWSAGLGKGRFCEPNGKPFPCWRVVLRLEFGPAVLSSLDDLHQGLGYDVTLAG